MPPAPLSDARPLADLLELRHRIGTAVRRFEGARVGLGSHWLSVNAWGERHADTLTGREPWTGAKLRADVCLWRKQPVKDESLPEQQFEMKYNAGLLNLRWAAFDGFAALQKKKASRSGSLVLPTSRIHINFFLVTPERLQSAREFCQFSEFCQRP